MSIPLLEEEIVASADEQASFDNLFQILTAPQNLLLAVFGFGENRFRNPYARFLYNIYFLLMTFYMFGKAAVWLDFNSFWS